MSSLFHEIENNEALLLLYLANELSAEDRIEVEQMLSSDGGLRMELEEIRSALADSMAIVSSLDALEPASASADAVTIRRVGRARSMIGGLAQEMARQLLQNSPEAMALTKQVLWSSLEVGYRQAAEQAWAMIRMHWQHPDFAEGPRAFAERRPPRWSAG